MACDSVTLLGIEVVVPLVALEGDVQDRVLVEHALPVEVPDPFGRGLPHRRLERRDRVAAASGDVVAVPLDPRVEEVIGVDLPAQLSEAARRLLVTVGAAVVADEVVVLRRNVPPELVLDERPAEVRGRVQILLLRRVRPLGGALRAEEAVVVVVNLDEAVERVSPRFSRAV